MEHLVGWIVIIICTIVIVGLGFVQFKSNTPVGFYSGIKPPKKEEVTDIASYNKRHGMMWMLYGIGMPIAYGLGFFSKSSTLLTIAICVEMIGGIIVMMCYHNYLNRKYLKKNQ